MKRILDMHGRLILLVLLLPSLAQAVGLGRLSVLSVLGEKLSAEVELVSVQDDELSTLSVRPATIDSYQQTLRQTTAGVAGLLAHIQKRANGQTYIKLSSEQVIGEPFVDILLELNWATGRLVREYTLLIDPPNYARAQAPAPAPVPAAPPPAPVVADSPKPATTPTPSPPPAPADEYGPIKRGETLSRIAARLKPEGVTQEQMLIAIFRNNPDAFINRNINRLKADKILRIPRRELLIAIPQTEAVREIRGQISDRTKPHQKPPVNPRAKERPAGGKPVLRLS